MSSTSAGPFLSWSFGVPPPLYTFICRTFRSHVRRSSADRRSSEILFESGPTTALKSNIVCGLRSEEHTSELQSLMRISYAVFCLKKKKLKSTQYHTYKHTTL